MSKSSYPFQIPSQPATQDFSPCEQSSWLPPPCPPCLQKEPVLQFPCDHTTTFHLVGLGPQIRPGTIPGSLHWSILPPNLPLLPRACAWLRSSHTPAVLCTSYRWGKPRNRLVKAHVHRAYLEPRRAQSRPVFLLLSLSASAGSKSSVYTGIFPLKKIMLSCLVYMQNLKKLNS